MVRPETQEELNCELSSIAVRPAVWGRGIGKALMRSFIEVARNKSAKAIYLTTDAKDNDRTNDFYLSFKFRLSETFLTPSRRVMHEYILELQNNTEAGNLDEHAKNVTI